jgi:hypothetical protein
MMRMHLLRVLPSLLLVLKMSLRELLWGLNDRLAAKLIKIRDLVDDINSLRFKLDQKLEKVARVVGVVDALDEPL